MDGILENLSSPSWWFTAVFVALLIGIIAHYLPRLLEKALKTHLNTGRDRNEKSRQNIEKNVQFLVDNPELIPETNIIGRVENIGGWIFTGLGGLLLAVSYLLIEADLKMPI